MVDWLVAGIAIVLIAGGSAMALRHLRVPEAAMPASRMDSQRKRPGSCSRAVSIRVSARAYG